MLKTVSRYTQIILVAAGSFFHLDKCGNTVASDISQKQSESLTRMQGFH